MIKVTISYVISGTYLLNFFLPLRKAKLDLKQLFRRHHFLHRSLRTSHKTREYASDLSINKVEVCITHMGTISCQKGIEMLQYVIIASNSSNDMPL